MLRDNNTNGYPWHGPSVLLSENAEPVMGSQLEDDRQIIVFKDEKTIFLL